MTVQSSSLCTSDDCFFQILQASHPPKKASPLPKRTAAPQGLAGTCTSGMRGTLYGMKGLQIPAVKR